MRFAIVGTHNSGKTTLCHEVTSRLMRRGVPVSYAPEPSRTSRFLAAGTRDLKTQLDIFVRTVSTELEAARGRKIVVCDRSLVDVLAYTDFMEERPSLEEKLTREAMHAFADKYLLTYRLFFKVCWSFDMDDSSDPLRIDGSAFQADIDTRIEHHLARLSLPTRRLTDSVQAAEQVERQIIECITSES